MYSRDDFTTQVKQQLAARVGYRCSNPGCRATTSGPQVDPLKALSIGVAAHITAAAAGGPRYQPELSATQRIEISNGIWLCQSCAKLVDNDPQRFTLNTLRQWKFNAEQAALEAIGKTSLTYTPSVIIMDKWVGLGYETASGLAESLRQEGYNLHWCSADKESDRVDLAGWEYVLIDQQDGTNARLKIHDHPIIGGYLVLLKKRQQN